MQERTITQKKNYISYTLIHSRVLLSAYLDYKLSNSHHCLSVEAQLVTVNHRLLKNK